MAIEADLLRGYTDTILLRQLACGDSYGYMINKRIGEQSGGEIELKEATLYTAFRRLEHDGFIRSYWGDENTGARRRYYTLTPEGKLRLEKDAEKWRETREILNKLIGDETDVYETDV
ncbi:MAG: helix-turn-helix transcriptional regulator [Clostridia bacterium]|nr:helix-turn-helix transcriptional regulator [Clostridia bacterium]